MINIDTVYQKVLVVANKEQRGYITPQEFNLFADQAQMDIFEQYFYDINQFGRMASVGVEYSDIDEKIDEKLSIFKTRFPASGGNIVLPLDLYKIGNVSEQTSGNEIHRVSNREFGYIQNSPLAAPTAEGPIYTIDENGINITPNVSAIIRYIRTPLTPKWTYSVINEKAQYNASALDLQHFELHRSDETELILKILQLAGVTIKNPNLYQLAAQEEIKGVQQEKQ
jgi:hypothetical protein